MFIDELIKLMDDHGAFEKKAFEGYKIFLNGRKDSTEEWDNYMTCLFASISNYKPQEETNGKPSV